MNSLKERIAPLQSAERRLDDLEVMAELLAEEEGVDEASLEELLAEAKQLEKEMARLALETLLSGAYDKSDAILEIQAGAGGTDACDWVRMLQRMYVRWAENRGFKTEVVDESEGEVDGLKNTTLMIHGKNAYGYLVAEHGVHRLVRISPYDSNKRRQTSFARVEVLPDIGEEIKIEINPDDLRIDYYRSSGAGGQHVNKTDSAVRLVHLPTNTVVTCQNERSQHKNKAMAMQVLQARLIALEQQQSEQRRANLRGEAKANEWGSQDRSYVFHPYTLVKDVRTNYETGDVVGVMNGALDPFMDAWLQWRQAQKNQVAE